MAAGKDLGLCGCQGVETCFLECSRAYERLSEEIEQQDALDEIMPNTELLTEVPISILVAETMDTGEADRDTADSIVAQSPAPPLQAADAPPASPASQQLLITTSNRVARSKIDTFRADGWHP